MYCQELECCYLSHSNWHQRSPFFPMGPPTSIRQPVQTKYHHYIYTYSIINSYNHILEHLVFHDFVLTRTVESLAARAMISAQETVLGHSCSSADLISSITSNPRTEFLLGFDPFSLTMLPLLSRSIDASHPYIESIKKTSHLINHKVCFYLDNNCHAKCSIFQHQTTDYVAIGYKKQQYTMKILIKAMHGCDVKQSDKP